MKDSYYFSHDYNARNDEKIKNLLREHSMVGYGLFWAIVEELYNNANAMRTHYKGIAYDLRSDEHLVKSVVEDFGLFVIKDGFFMSTSIQRRIEQREEKSAKAKGSAEIRWKKSKEENANASEKHANASKNDAIKERKERKGKKDDETPPTVKLHSISDCRNLYDQYHQDAISSIGIAAGILKEKFYLFQNSFDEWLTASGKSHKALNDYSDHFARWMAKLTPERRQEIYQKAIKPKKEKSIIEKYS